MRNLQGALDFKASYPVSKLIEYLKANRQRHVEDLKKAIQVYFEDLEKLTSELNRDARERKFRKDSYKIDVFGDYKPPVDAVKLYDQYIDLLEQSTSEEVELTPTDYNAIVNDEWEWALQARSVNAAYSSKFRG